MHCGSFIVLVPCLVCLWAPAPDKSLILGPDTLGCGSLCAVGRAPDQIEEFGAES